jgi:hypothetical protein
MRSPLFSYLFFSAATLFAFSNFIACGAKMYQVPLDDEQERTVIKRKEESGSSLRSSLVGVHATKGWVKLPIEYRFSRALSKEQRVGLENAMKTWEAAVGRPLFTLVGEDQKTGDSFNDLYSSLSDSTNGHYIDDNWAKTGKSTQVLATTIWNNLPGDDETIRSADIRFNGNYYVIGDSFISKATSEKEVVDMQSLALHELGHLIGLTHMSVEDDSMSIMNPTLFIGEGLANRRLSEGDIRRIQSVYGCQGQSCDLEKTLALVNSGLSSDTPAH